MGLFAIHTAEIVLPEYAPSIASVGGNKVSWIASPTMVVSCNFFEDRPKTLLARTVIGAPWNEIIIRLPRCREALPDGLPVLRIAGDFSDVSQLGAETRFEWLRHPSSWLSCTPDDIVTSWKDQFRFLEGDDVNGVPGLRRPQIGAVHAIAAYLSVRAEQPATVVMPTGTGKTEAMLGALVCCQCPRVLVLVPSDALRTQMFGKFVGLGCLPDIGVVPGMVTRPRVALIRRGIQDPDECRNLVAGTNVLIALPESLKSFSTEAREALVQFCTHLFIDEAHHVAAPTWAQIRDMFTGKPIVQFTATPFRRDGKSLEGRVIFNYKLGDAQKEGYFRHIRLRTVEDYSDTEVDENIAASAVGILRDDLREGHDHLILARTSTIDRARELLPIYRRLAPDLGPVVVHSRTNARDQADAFARLASRTSRIIICVDMFGEGFDLPNLKIAAIHDHHKTLAVTLQFIGRFTRIAPNVGDAAAVVNIAEPKAQDELQALFAEDADWDKILCWRSEDAIGREVALLDLVNNMGDQGDLARQLSLWNLRPACSAVIYQTPCVAWSPQGFAGVLPERCTRWYALSPVDGVLVVVVARTEEVKWGRYRDIKDQTFELMVAHWDQVRGALFLHCSDYDFFRSQRMAEALCGEHTVPITGDQLFRVFGGVEFPMVRNLGASKAGTISFTMYFGPNVTDGLAQVEKAGANLSNLMGWGYEHGSKVTWGCSQKKGKIWSVHGGPITEWLDWCRSAWDKIADSNTPESAIIAGFLRPVELKARHPSCPVFVQWGERIAGEREERVTISIGEQEFHTHEVDLEVAEYSETVPLSLRIEAGTSSSTYELHIASSLPLKYEYRLVAGSVASIQIGRGRSLPFPEHMVKDPVVFTYADGSFSYNAYIVRVPEDRQPFDRKLLDAWDWQGTNIRIESQGRNRLSDSVQYRLCQEFRDSYTVLFDDDASGEAADIIGIRCADDRVMKLCLVHCKFSSGDAPGARVDDMYTLCGQGQKCVRWKHNGFAYLVDHMKRREAQWTSDGATRFVKGGLADLHRLKRMARGARLELEVILVQPGLSKASVTDPILELLGSTQLYLKKTADAKLSVVCSE